MLYAAVDPSDLQLWTPRTLVNRLAGAILVPLDGFPWKVNCLSLVQGCFLAKEASLITHQVPLAEVNPVVSSGFAFWFP